MDAIAPHQTAQAQQSNAIPTEPIWRLTVDQYHAMVQAGILQDGDRLELLEGLLVAKMTKNPPHRLATGLLQDALLGLLPANYHLNNQEPITLADSEPEPDLSIIIGQRVDYRDRHPDASVVALVIEVADRTLERDRSLKQRIYARAGIPVYWILNLRDRQLECYTQPNTNPDSAEPHYRQCTILVESASIPVYLNDPDHSIGHIPVKNLL